MTSMPSSAQPPKVATRVTRSFGVRSQIQGREAAGAAWLGGMAIGIPAHHTGRGRQARIIFAAHQFLPPRVPSLRFDTHDRMHYSSEDTAMTASAPLGSTAHEDHC